jgi:hypothetical protein
MKAEHTIDKPARAGRATQIAAMVITGLVAFIWVYLGRLYLIHDPDEWRIANQQLGYLFAGSAEVSSSHLSAAGEDVTRPTAL